MEYDNGNLQKGSRFMARTMCSMDMMMRRGMMMCRCLPVPVSE